MNKRKNGEKTLFSRYSWLQWTILICGLTSGVSCGWDPSDSITITAEDFRFNPAQVVVPADRPLKLIIRNQGRERHVFHSPRLFREEDFFLDASRIGMEGAPETLILEAGTTITISMELSPGNYPFRCWMKGHTGMEGTIIVEGGKSLTGYQKQ